jgi:hypothetical protein
MIGEYLYQLTTKDAITAPILQRKHKQTTAAVGSVSVSATDDVTPNDKVLVVTNVSAEAISGAAQTSGDVRVVLEDDVGNSLGTIGRQTGAPLAVFSLALTGLALVLFPGERLRATGTYNAGAAANTTSITVHGFFLPKGNLQLR